MPAYTAERQVKRPRPVTRLAEPRFGRRPERGQEHSGIAITPAGAVCSAEMFHRRRWGIRWGITARSGSYAPFVCTTSARKTVMGLPIWGRRARHAAILAASRRSAHRSSMMDATRASRPQTAHTMSTATMFSTTRRRRPEPTARWAARCRHPCSNSSSSQPVTSWDSHVPWSETARESGHMVILTLCNARFVPILSQEVRQGKSPA